MAKTPEEMSAALTDTIAKMVRVLNDTGFIAPEHPEMVAAKVAQAFILWDETLVGLGWSTPLQRLKAELAESKAHERAPMSVTVNRMASVQSERDRAQKELVAVARQRDEARATLDAVTAERDNAQAERGQLMEALARADDVRKAMEARLASISSPETAQQRSLTEVLKRQVERLVAENGKLKAVASDRNEMMGKLTDARDEMAAAIRERDVLKEGVVPISVYRKIQAECDSMYLSQMEAEVAMQRVVKERDALKQGAVAAADRDAVFAQLAEMRKKLDDCRGDNGRLTDEAEKLKERASRGVSEAWHAQVKREMEAANAKEVDRLRVALVDVRELIVLGHHSRAHAVIDAALAKCSREDERDPSAPNEHPPCRSVVVEGIDQRQTIPKLKPVKVDVDAVAWARADAEADAQRRAVISRMHGLGHIAEGGHPETEECGAPIGSTFCCLDKGHEGNHESEDQQDERAR